MFSFLQFFLLFIFFPLFFSYSYFINFFHFFSSRSFIFFIVLAFLHPLSSVSMSMLSTIHTDVILHLMCSIKLYNTFQDAFPLCTCKLLFNFFLPSLLSILVVSFSNVSTFLHSFFLFFFFPFMLFFFIFSSFWFTILLLWCFF